MIVHKHAYLKDGSHLLIIEIGARAHGKWGGYVQLRLVDIDNATASRITQGKQDTFLEQEGFIVLKALDANSNSKGSRSKYAKAMLELEASFADALEGREVEAFGLMTGKITQAIPASSDDQELMEHLQNRSKRLEELGGLGWSEFPERFDA